MGTYGLVKARRKKESTYYVTGIISFLAPLGFILLILNQIVLGLFLLGAIFVISIIMLPKVVKLRVRELQGVDLSTPMRKREYLSDKMWLKLAQRWGVWKAVCIYSLFIGTPIGVALYILSAYGIMPLESVATATIIATIGFAITIYYQTSKALKRSEPSKA